MLRGCRARRSSARDHVEQSAALPNGLEHPQEPRRSRGGGAGRYVAAFASIGSFEGRSALSTWLTRIVVNEALSRRRSDQRRRRQLEQEGVAVMDSYRDALMRGSDSEPPDAALAREQVRKLLERAVAELPDLFRTVFVMRDVEGMSSDETAHVLGVPVATVKTRLFRGRRRLQELLAPELGTALSGTFPFAGADCAALTERVLVRLGF